jgi:amino acid adenylation domain-containing protein
MNFIKDLQETFISNKNNRAFCVDGRDISYGEFLEYINGARIILEKTLHDRNNPVGIVSYECIETYAAIFATWFSGNHIVPVNPKHPVERNMRVFNNTGVKVVFSVKDNLEGIIEPGSLTILNNSKVKSGVEMGYIGNYDKQIMYILTTSGSTGIPKHVPISVGNVTSYRRGFLKAFPEINSETCYLQTHDHTTDSAFTSYLLPLSVGGCVYILPDDQFKFLSIAKLMNDKKINWVKLTPSVLQYLSPYISKLDLQHIQYFAFVGEALPVSLVEKWWPKFPNAEVINFYGPTEATMLSTFYRIKNINHIREKNGVVSIGIPFPEKVCAIIDENDKIVEQGADGELCVGGKQIMKGYLKQDKNPYVYLNINGVEEKFYRTGDVVRQDEEGYFYFLGRTDDQVKIQGYRINLIEVENIIRKIVPDKKVVVVSSEKSQGIKRLFVFIEQGAEKMEKIKLDLGKYLPAQLVPDEIIVVPEFPFTASGKVDKKSLEKRYLQHG